MGEYAPSPDRLTSSDGNADVGEDMSDSNEENRRLLAALIEQVPELEAPQKRPGASEIPGGGPVRAESPARPPEALQTALIGLGTPPSFRREGR